MVSPALYDRLVRPYHQRLCEYFAADGLATLLHSDGNVAPLIPHFLTAGFRGLHPLECKAGLDVRALRRQYGERLVLFGNIDVRALAGTPEQVVEEVTAKVSAGMVGGGYLFHSDHSVPSDVPLSNYLLALETARDVGRYATA
jgi:uroporphyrinogen decarboxylase